MVLICRGSHSSARRFCSSAGFTRLRRGFNSLLSSAGSTHLPGVHSSPRGHSRHDADA
jgi:hypothetical protein